MVQLTYRLCISRGLATDCVATRLRLLISGLIAIDQALHLGWLALSLRAEHRCIVARALIAELQLLR